MGAIDRHTIWKLAWIDPREEGTGSLANKYTSFSKQAKEGKGYSSYSPQTPSKKKGVGEEGGTHLYELPVAVSVSRHTRSPSLPISCFAEGGEGIGGNENGPALSTCTGVSLFQDCAQKLWGNATICGRNEMKMLQKKKIIKQRCPTILTD